MKDLALLAGRAIIGGYQAVHGAQMLFGSFGGPGLEPISQAFHHLGLRPSRPMATAAACLELGGGLLTVTGVADPLGPLTVAGTMAVASWTHADKGPFAANGGYELTLTNLASVVALAAAGAGRYAVGRRLPRPLVIATVVGSVVTAGAIMARGRRTKRLDAAAVPAAHVASPAEDLAPEMS